MNRGTILFVCTFDTVGVLVARIHGNIPSSFRNLVNLADLILGITQLGGEGSRSRIQRNSIVSSLDFHNGVLPKGWQKAAESETIPCASMVADHLHNSVDEYSAMGAG